MNAGSLDRRITIEAPTITTNDVGAEVVTWATWAADVPAQVRTESSRDRILAGRITEEMAYLVTIRYRDGITPKMRLQYDGKTLTIAGPPREVGRRAFLEMTALHAD